MEYTLFGAFLHASILVKLIIAALLVMSVHTWAIVFSKFFHLKKLSADIDMMLKETQQPNFNIDNLLAKSLNTSNKSLYTILSHIRTTLADSVVSKNDSLKEDLEDIFYNFIQDQRKKDSALAIIATSSPFIGLLGTVLGIINAFFAISAAGTSSLNDIGPGIAEALYATAFGLFVAIPAYIAFNYFTSLIDSFENQGDKAVFFILKSQYKQ